MVTLVDQYGRDMDRRVLEEPQADRARVGWLHRTFANHPSNGLTPPALQRALVAAEQGDLVAQCELFADMEERDGHLAAELGKRKRALLNVDWHIVPPRNASAREKAAADQLTEYLEDLLCLDDLLLDMGDAIAKGYSHIEIEWEQVEKQWLPRQFHWRDPTWFTYDAQGLDYDTHELLLRTQSGRGEPLQPFGWIRHEHKAKSGHVSRAGLGRVLVWPYLYKNYAVRDLAEFLEIYGLPMRLGRYAKAESDENKATLMRAVVGIGHSAAGIIPHGMDIEFMEAAQGRGDTFEAMIAWSERTVSKAILGGTLTSQADGASSTNALGNVHNEVRKDLRDSDLGQVAATLNRDLLFPLAYLNIDGIDNPRRCPRLVFNTRAPEDLKLYADALPNLVDIDFQIPTAFAHKMLQIPEPEGDEPVLRRVNKTAGSEPATKSATESLELAILKEQRAITGPASQAALSALSDMLSPELLQGQMEQLLGVVMALDGQGEDLSVVEDQLVSLFPQLDTQAIEEMLTRLFFVAELWGQASE